jgi:hypothetical protein
MGGKRVRKGLAPGTTRAKVVAFEIDPKALDGILLTALCALGDADAVAERGYSGNGDVKNAVTLLRQLREELKDVSPARPKTGKRYQMFLESVGNPDFGQYAPISPPKWVDGDTLPELAKAADAYRREWFLGGGNWPGMIVYEGDKPICHFSYNLRCWKGQPEDLPKDPKEWGAYEVKIGGAS